MGAEQGVHHGPDAAHYKEGVVVAVGRNGGCDDLAAHHVEDIDKRQPEDAAALVDGVRRPGNGIRREKCLALRRGGELPVPGKAAKRLPCGSHVAAEPQIRRVEVDKLRERLRPPKRAARDVSADRGDDHPQEHQRDGEREPPPAPPPPPAHWMASVEHKAPGRRGPPPSPPTQSPARGRRRRRPHASPARGRP